jgi:hypothetical protein
MIDEGFHPMTIYFPLVAHGAMLIEPTESESKASLDLFIAALRDLALTAKRGDTGALPARLIMRPAAASTRPARRETRDSNGRRPWREGAVTNSVEFVQGVISRISSPTPQSDGSLFWLSARMRSWINSRGDFGFILSGEEA